MADPILWQFKYSHYNEKVRWALDFKRLPHRRRSLLPGPHAVRVLWMTGQKSVPVLVLNGKAIADSTRIIEALEALQPAPPLYPADPRERERALALEEFFDEELGPQIRRAWFFQLLPHADYTAAQLAVGWSARTQRVYRMFYPVLRRIMTMDMQIDAAGAEVGRAKIHAALDRIQTERQARDYLVGDRFTVADLTAAGLLAPIVMPPEFAYPTLRPLPASAEQFRAAFARHPSFEWAADMFRRHRGTSMEVAA